MTETGQCAICGAPLRPSTRGDRCLRCLLAIGLEEEVPAEETQTEGTPNTKRLGDYELLEEIARGGMGIIYKARQISLNRTVAVKMLLAGSFAVPEFVQRFRTEAEAAASLHHPNIVPIHEFGRADGQYFLVMDYVDGQNLGQTIRKQPLPPRPVAVYLKTIAEAVEYAHQQGILHRDLKPTNVLVDLNNEVRITDFGLAKRLASESDITITGQTIGSPTYSAPEQVAGKHKEVGPHSDVYSLGAMLYEMLTGRPPFVGESITAVLQQVQEREVVGPRLLNPGVPKDLESICLKCLEKDWRRRYTSAAALAEDLGRFLRGEATEARPIRIWGRVQRWFKRKPMVAALASGIILLLLLVLVGSPVAILQINRQRKAALEHAAKEAEQRQQSERTLRRFDAERIRDFFENDRAADGVAWLAYLLRQNPKDEAASEWLVNELTQRSFAVPVIPPLSHTDMVHFATFSPEGTRILTVCRDNAARLWDAATGKLICPPLSHDGSVVRAGEFYAGSHPLHANFSADGTLVATASVDGTVCLWDGFTGQPVGQPLKHPNRVWWACLSPDNRRLATGCQDGLVRLWDAASGQNTGPNLTLEAPPDYFEFSPDGEFIVTSSEDGTVRVWQVATGKPRGEPMRHRGPVRWACFSPGGKRVLTASGASEARVWDAENGKPLTPILHHDQLVTSAMFSPDGRWVVTGSFDMTARVWDSFTGEPAGEPLRHGGYVRWVEFSPDGQRVVTAAEDGTARVWDAHTCRPITEPLSHDGIVWSARFSPDGRHVITASGDRTARVWDVRPGQALELTLREPGHQIRYAEWSPDGQRVATVSESVYVWDARTGLQSSARLDYRGQCWKVRFTPDNSQVITLPENGLATLLPLQRQSPPTQLQHPCRSLHVDFSRDGEWVVTASADGMARVWNRDSGKPTCDPMQHGDAVWTAEFSPDGKLIVTASADHRACIWRAESGALAATPLQHDGQVVMATFSPDGQQVLTASSDGTARIWDAQSGQPSSPALRHRGPITCARFSPNGQLVVTASEDKTARIWDAHTYRPRRGLLIHQGKVVTADFSPDSRRVLTGSADGTARIWEVALGQPLGEPLRHNGPLRAAAFSPDGQWVLTASEDSTARIWRFVPVAGPVPDWMPALAEAVVGRRISEERTEEVVPAGSFLRLKVSLGERNGSDLYGAWAKWLLADRGSRAIAPDARLCIPEYIRHKVQAANRARPQCLEDLTMVVRFEPTNGAAFAQMARIIDSTGRALMPQDLAALDWASRKAIRLSPADATAWWGRAAYLKRSGDKAEALEAMERALKIGMEEAYFHLDHASLLVDTGNMAEACEAFQRARSYIWNFPEWLECFEREQAVEGWALRFAQEHPSPEAGRIRRFSLGIPERPQDTPVHQIDLSDFYNTALNDLWRMKDLDYGGRTDLLVNGVARCPVQFDLRGLIQIANPGPTAEIKNMPVGQSCRFLWFLHGARNEEVEGTEIARYVLHTADGVEHVVPVVYGKDVLIWATPEKGASRSLESIWEFSAKHGYHQRLFVTQWRNPDPTVRVETVDFICHDTKAVPFLIAITAEP